MLLRQLGKARVPPAPSNVLRARSRPGWKQVLVLVLSNIPPLHAAQGGRHVFFCKERGAEAEQKAECREEGEEGGTWRAARSTRILGENHVGRGE